MLWLTTLLLSLRSLWASKLRSVLAVLGIVIGVTAVIALLALGDGARSYLLKQVAQLQDICFVYPSLGKRNGVSRHAMTALSMSDALHLARLPAARSTAPLILSSASVRFYNHNAQAQIFGSSSNYFELRQYRFASGRGFSELEEETAAPVMVLASKTAKTLFGDDDPVGEVVLVGQHRLRVIGVLRSKDDDLFNDSANDRVIIGIGLARLLYTRSTSLTQLLVQRRGEVLGEDFTKQVELELRQLHHLRPDDSDDFGIFSAQEEIEKLASITLAMTALLGSIGGIALLVGGIGIMNIMLVSVTERTREIGVRKAIGARERDILRQFLIEAVLLCSIGGALGVVLGAGLMWIAGKFMPFQPIIEPVSVVVALSFSAGVGIFFGFYPAVRASRLDPIQALHHE